MSVLINKLLLTCVLATGIVLMICNTAYAIEQAQTGCRKYVNETTVNPVNPEEICETGECSWHRWPDECSFTGDKCLYLICIGSDVVIHKREEQLVPDYNSPPQYEYGEEVICKTWLKISTAGNALVAFCGNNGNADCALERLNCSIAQWAQDIVNKLGSLSGFESSKKVKCQEPDGLPV